MAVVDIKVMTVMCVVLGNVLEDSNLFHEDL